MTDTDSDLEIPGGGPSQPLIKKVPLKKNKLNGDWFDKGSEGDEESKSSGYDEELESDSEDSSYFKTMSDEPDDAEIFNDFPVNKLLDPIPEEGQYNLTKPLLKKIPKVVKVKRTELVRRRLRLLWPIIEPTFKKLNNPKFLIWKTQLEDALIEWYDLDEEDKK